MSGDGILGARRGFREVLMKFFLTFLTLLLMFLEAYSYDWDQDYAMKDFLSNTLIFKAFTVARLTKTSIFENKM